MLTKRLMDGARNYIRWCDIQAGDKVMIVTSKTPPLADKEVAEVITLAAEDKGAEVFELHTKPWNILAGERAPNYVNEAAKGCDVFIGLVPIGGFLAPGFGGIKGVKEFLARNGTTWQTCRMATTERMSSDHAIYPVDLIFAISKLLINRFVKGKTCRVTTPKGTDVSMGINPDYWSCSGVLRKKPGAFYFNGFPGAAYGIIPWKPYNGKIVVDAFMPQWNPAEIFIKPGDAIITVEDSRATNITGIYSDWISNILDRDKNGRLAAECMFGYHPHACPVPWQSPAEWFESLHDRSTALHLAFGNPIGGAGPFYSSIHFDVYMYYPTVYIDGEKLIDAGHFTLLEDPGLREYAKQFGDPDYLLQEKTIPKVVENLIKK